ncbi:uncharacterized protein LOC126749130 [Anthonomus grandis grandis]|uniref:uncharacterized protein LOC126749130 n=1 Tax=Anthonomus grandis grandis TaxID=2921223 RepID=UPI0021664440|nr:uncharacterized protein LOC126749130 [Anthonomus grandis grandis]
MLRSVFSLIQRIIDFSEKNYTNTKSKSLIFCFVNLEHIGDMNLESEDKEQLLKSLEYNKEANRIQPTHKNCFPVEPKHGDAVTSKPKTKTDNRLPQEGKDELKRITFWNSDKKGEDKVVENAVDAEIQPNVHLLIDQLSEKRIEIASKESDQVSTLLEQVKKMKTGLERLQEIAMQFNCSERFNEDVNYLMNNAREYLRRQKDDNSNVSPKV